MAVPQLSEAQIQEISILVANCIQTQRQKFAAQAVELPSDLRVQLDPFFRPNVLNTTRVVVVEKEKAGNPEFYPMLHGLGFTNLPDFAGMAAITLHDVIVSHEARTPPLLLPSTRARRTVPAVGRRPFCRTLCERLP